MKLSRLYLLPVICAAFTQTLPAAGETATGECELLEVKKIWDEARHNAFTDLVRFNGKWVCGFREAPAHAGGVKDSRMRIVTSGDGEEWKAVAALSDARGDIRDAKFGILPDGRLMMLTAIQKFDTSESRHQSLVWFTSDLEEWEGPHDVGEPDIWLWGITWHDEVGYSIGYSTGTERFIRLYQTRDGREFEVLVEDLQVDDPYPNESKIVFGADGVAYCLLRTKGPAQVGVSRPPYTDWAWRKVDQPVGGPNMLLLPDGRLLGGGRLYQPHARTALFWIDPESDEIEECLSLPSGGDTSYPGLVWHEGILWMSYYSSHESRSSIYLAKIKPGAE